MTKYGEKRRGESSHGTNAYGRRRMLAAVAVICLMTGMLWGCSDDGVDYDPDTEQDVQADAGGMKQFQGSPDWKETIEYTAADGRKCTMEVNAEVRIPNVDAMSVVEVEETGIDTDFKRQLMDQFLEGADIYYHDISHQTREELEKLIEEEEGWVQTLENDLNLSGEMSVTDDVIESWQKDLDERRARLQQYWNLYENAGDEYTLAEDLESCREFIGYRDGIAYTISFPEEGEYVYISILPGELFEGIPTYVPEKLESYDYRSCTEETLEEGTNQCTMSREDAQAMVEQWLLGCGRSHQQLIEVGDLVWTGINDAEDGEEDSISLREGYCFSYGTGVDGLAFRSFGSYTDYSDAGSFDVWGGVEYDLFESTRVYVDNAGVIGVIMNCPVTVTKITEQVELLPLSAIQNIMKHEITENSDQYHYEDWEQRSYFRSNALELIYFRVKSGTPGSYSYVPAWRLCNESEYNCDNPILVNAIDGSVIYPGQELSDWGQDAVPQ